VLLRLCVFARKLLPMLLFALLLSFLIGSIPFGVLLGKMRGVDVRSVGSGNIGATNVWRALGPAFGALSFALDMLKGLAGPLLGRWLIHGLDANFNDWIIAACGIAAVLGHIFSPFLGFKGGKGISTSLGALFGLMPLVGLLALALWGVVLGLTRIISAASIAACIGLPIVAVLLHVPTPFFVVALLMGLFAFVKHIPNLKRIAARTEPKIGAKKAT
jgi:glycerol-3-phosphate acyltransferase PlsY